jgi:acetyl esterase/lipase
MATNIKFDVEVRDLEYQNQAGKSWQARVYQPKGTGPFPAIIDVHGGAWHNGDRTNNVGINQALAEAGVVVAALDFRQPPEAGYPASIQDINLGIRWLKAQAKEFNSSTTVGAFGNSSGGHQVVLAGLRRRDPRYSALPLPGRPEVDGTLGYVIAAWPVIDPLYRYKHVALAGGRQELISAHQDYWGTEEAMEEGAAITAVEKEPNIAKPPILMMLKTNDSNHPQAMQDAFVEAYRRKGGDIEVKVFEGLPEHRMSISADQPEGIRAIETMLDFITRKSGLNPGR